MPRLSRLISLTAALVCFSGGTAMAADGPVGADPAQNFSVTTLPAVCNQPTSPACLDASVAFLNQARASLGQPPYVLPSNFDSLTPTVQAFVLTNLDRQLYGLSPITGITAGLSQDAMGGVQNDNDPQPTDTTFNYWTANWAGGFDNVVLAYEAWMYDDGPGSGNLDCTARNTSGCWGHRHDILWSFSGTGALAAGVAVATDPSGSPGYAMLLGEGDPNHYRPAYTYTWSQAVAAGAGAGSATGSAAGSGSANATGTGSGAATGQGSAPKAPAPRKVTVTVSVHGTGAIIDQSGRSCHNATCTFTETPGQAIHLTAHADSRTTFAGWGGACSGARTTCTLTPGASAATVSAAFAAKARLSRRTPRSPRAHASSLSSGHVSFGRNSAHATVRVHRRRIEVRVSAPGALRCALSFRRHGRFARDHFHRCWSDTIYVRVPRGVYRLRVRTAAGVITRYVRSR